MTAFKRPVSALVVIINGQGRLLVLQKRKWPLFWQSVTGSLEENETPLAAAKRELMEETGLTLEQGFLVDTGRVHTYQIYDRFKPRYHPEQKTNQEHVFYFWASDKAQVQISDEHLQAGWVSLKTSLKCVFSDSNRQEVIQCVRWQQAIRQGQCLQRL